jgi:hypothetical protein
MLLTFSNGWRGGFGRVSRSVDERGFSVESMTRVEGKKGQGRPSEEKARVDKSYGREAGQTSDENEGQIVSELCRATYFLLVPPLSSCTNSSDPEERRDSLPIRSIVYPTRQTTGRGTPLRGAGTLSLRFPRSSPMLPPTNSPDRSTQISSYRDSKKKPIKPKRGPVVQASFGYKSSLKPKPAAWEHL